MKNLLIPCLLLLLGCTSLTQDRNITSPDQALLSDCRYYDEAFLAWKAVAFVGEGMAAATGTATALVEGLSDQDDWVLGLSTTGAVGALLGGLGIYMSSEYAERYSRRCLLLESPESPSP